MPSGQTAHPHITNNKDGTVTVKYSPTERGLHEMDIKYDGNHIPGKLCPTLTENMDLLILFYSVRTNPFLISNDVT